MTGGRRFFSPWNPTDQTVTIDGEEFHHIKTVLRACEGEEIELINGRGGLSTARISLIQPNRLQAELEKKTNHPSRATAIAIAPSPTRSANTSWMMEKLCELGVDEIFPILCQRTEFKSSHTETIKRRWEKIAIQALKVNQRLWLTTIHTPLPLYDFLKRINEFPSRLLLDIDSKQCIPGNLPAPVLAAIGPPGDFTKAEKEVIISAGFSPVMINRGILKTETAAIAVAAVMTHV